MDELCGRTIGNRWRLERRLGVGGMGTVYLATDLQGGPAVAIKLVRLDLADDREAGLRFEREAAAMARLAHDNIVRFNGTGVDGGLRWIAMELLTGRTLKERVESRGALRWRETLPIVRGICQALAVAHAQGLIHRDLKPENVFLLDGGGPEEPPRVKLLDFGVAKHTQVPQGMTMTGTGFIVGTPGFVAPEVVLRGTSDDPRSDFYGLGATWFEMLAGRKPFSAATPFALAMRHASEAPPRVHDLQPAVHLPARLEVLLMALLAKTPEARPPNAAALLAELADLDALAAITDDELALTERTMTDVLKAPAGTMVMPAPAAMAASPAGSPAKTESSMTPATSLAAPAPSQLHGQSRPRLLAAAVIVACAVIVGAGILIARATQQRAFVETPPVEPASPLPPHPRNAPPSVGETPPQPTEEPAPSEPAAVDAGVEEPVPAKLPRRVPRPRRPDIYRELTPQPAPEQPPQ